MRSYFSALLILATIGSHAAAKTHVVSFGKWTAIKWAAGPEEDKLIDAKVRAIYVDAQLKEFTVGSPHEITDRLFAVRRVVRVNDTLPQENATLVRWVWQPAGWLMVDRVSGHITQIGLADFDPYTSLASWYRDYVAYCGVSDDGKKLEAVVAQAGRRKPVLKKKIGEPANDGEPLCAAPGWERQPMRVSFEQKSGDKLTYSVHGRAVETIKEEEEEESTD
ncbi:MAG TPA: hypothetical protein VF753_03850 [Terriglobales bacterium]